MPPRLTTTLSHRFAISRMRHDGCGGRAGKVELLTGIEGVSSRPVRRIVLVVRYRMIRSGKHA